MPLKSMKTSVGQAGSLRPIANRPAEFARPNFRTSVFNRADAQVFMTRQASAEPEVVRYS